MSVAVRVPRPALDERLHAALERGAAVLVAGAGYGKTVLVEQALDGRQVAWMSCRGTGGDPARLLLAGLDAARAAVPGVADVLFERIRDGVPPDVAAVTAALARELDALLVEPLVLVMDDAEHLAGTPGAVELVNDLIASEPRRLRIVVCSRRPLPLSLARLEAGGRLLRLGESDLAFSAEEAAALLEARLGRPPEDAEVADALRTTLGWPLGLALGASGGGDADELLGRFLAEEVLAPLDPETRRLVLASSAVEELTPAMTAALGLPADLRTRAGAAGVLLRPVAGAGDALAYHPLLRDLLRATWEAETAPDERQVLLGAAAGQLLAEGAVARAIDAWLDAGLHEPALDALGLHGERLARLSPTVAQGWLDRLGDAAAGDPRAAAVAGRLAALGGRNADAVEPLRLAADGLADADAAASARTQLAECLYWLGRLDEARDVIAAAPHATPDIRAWRVFALAAAGDIAAAEAALPALDDVATASAADVTFVLVALLDGRHEEAIARLIRRYDALPGEDRVGHWPQYVTSFLAFSLADMGHPEQALAWCDATVEEAQRLGTIGFLDALIHVQRAWLLAIAGREAEAELALAPLQGMTPPDGWAPAVAAATLALCVLARGEKLGCRAIAEQALELVAHAPVQFRMLVTWTLVLSIAETAGDDEAEAAVERALAWLDEAVDPPHGDHQRRRARALRAWLHGRRGDDAAAAADLAAVLEGPTADAILRAEWGRLGPLLHALLADDRLDAAVVLDAVRRALPDGEELVAFAAHPSPPTRAAAAVALTASGHPRAATVLRDLAGDDDPAVAAAAATALEAGLREPPPRTFQLFGGFALRRGGWTADERAWNRPTAPRLVRALLVRRGAFVPEEELLEWLWPEKTPKSARSVLQVAASRARSVLDPPGAEQSAIQFAGRAYRLALDERDRVDTELFARAAAEALGERGTGRLARLERAASLWGGEPLPEERYSDWATAWRSELEAEYGRVLRALAQERGRAGDHAGAAAAAARLVDLDPLDESAQRLLITAYARAGNRARALRQYLACRRELVDALGLEPADETRALQRRVLAGQPV